VHAFPHGLRQFLLVIRQQCFNLKMSLLADSVDLVVMLREKRPDLLLLLRSKLQVLC
jgi:hypothetical protein